MIERKRILINIVSTVIQVIITGCLYYALYKLILNRLGSNILGVWSIVLATSSIASIGGVGFTASLVKFIAEYISLKKEINRLLFTSLICTILFYLFFSLIIYIFGSFILSRVIEHNYLILALRILPFSLVILQTNAIATVFQSVLEGLQKNYIKNIIIIISNSSFLISSYLLLNKNANIFSIIYAQSVQSIVTFTLAFFLSCKYTGYRYLLKWNWSKEIFKEIFSYSLKFQIISICQILYDPITKGLLGRFSSLQTVAYYEMANRMIMQIRGVIINANQVIVPLIASVKNTSIDYVILLYKKSLRIITFFSLFATVTIIVFITSISRIWIGTLNKEFIFFSILLSIIYFFNIISGPAYFGNIGEGKLNKLLIQHIFIAIINVGCGFLFSIYGNRYGAVWAWGASVSIGAVYIINDYHESKTINFSKIFSVNEKVFFLISALCIVFLIISDSIENTQFSISNLFLKVTILFGLGCIFYFQKRRAINKLFSITLIKSLLSK